MAINKKPHLLVVGGTGFIGSNLVSSAIKKGWKVSSISLHYPKKKKTIKKVKYYIFDISSKKNFKKLLNKDFNYVVNLSGYIDHTLFNKGGIEQINKHFIGLQNLIYDLKRRKLKCFIQVGSSDEYGNSNSPQKENYRESPISPYALAKVSSTHFLQMLYRTEKFPCTIIRLFLTYGPGQNNKRFIPQIIYGCLNNTKFNVSSAKQKRDFCYISDVIEAIFLILKSKKSKGKIFNVSSGKATSIKFIIETIRKLIGKGSPQFGKISFRPGENMNLYADIGKIKKLVGWKPKISLYEGLNKTIESFK